MRNVCSVTGCPRFCAGRGFCQIHYMRFLRHGNPLGGRPTYSNDETRFWAKVDKNGPVPLGPCWIWKARRNPNGYGEFRFSNRTKLAHHHAYELLKGTIPEDVELDHVCDNPACVNPEHLYPVSHRVNMMRGKRNVAHFAALKTHCNKGHEFTAENTYVSQGHRKCRFCVLARTERYRRKHGITPRT